MITIQSYSFFLNIQRRIGLNWWFFNRFRPIFARSGLNRWKFYRFRPIEAWNGLKRLIFLPFSPDWPIFHKPLEPSLWLVVGGFLGIFWEIHKKVITLPYWKLLHRVSVPQGAELKGNQVRILNSTRCCKSQLIRRIGLHIATGCISLTKATSHYPGRREHDGDESEDLPTLQAYSCREA